ncbi:uncharacterized protein LOC128740901 [Sabethes cyaneus]|uniref:uncharacterized protein LOC128740901 n=1 Tax=Sabethes cyaneus TaxID=53552 RepID=UPI00237DDF86|nr:uncharacterized protein LOC128740901 [Sabethes cyaneus]
MSVDQKCFEESDTFSNWNHQLDSSGNSSDNLANLSYVFEVDSNDVSAISAADITPVNELQDDFLQELERSDRESKYSIIQTKLDLNERRGPKFQCQECQYSMHTRLSMITHMKMHLKPFCEVCFETFESQDAVICHINSFHPEVLIRERTPAPKDYYYMQTIAPPNTPNAISDDEMRTIEGLFNPIVVHPADTMSVQQLLGQHSNAEAINSDDEHGLIIGANRPSHSRVISRKRSVPILKRQIKKKSTTKCKLDTDAKPDNAMKKITSRFGRAISLKLPQY